MWINQTVMDWFKISETTVSDLRAEIASLKAERDTLQRHSNFLQTSFDWIRQRVNALEIERAQLLKKAYNIETLVPEITSPQPDFRRTLETMSSALFEDVGDVEAKKLGYPSYDLPNN